MLKRIYLARFNVAQYVCVCVYVCRCVYVCLCEYLCVVYGSVTLGTWGGGGTLGYGSVLTDSVTY